MRENAQPVQNGIILTVKSYLTESPSDCETMTTLSDLAEERIEEILSRLGPEIVAAEHFPSLLLVGAEHFPSKFGPRRIE